MRFALVKMGEEYLPCEIVGSSGMPLEHAKTGEEVSPIKAVGKAYLQFKDLVPLTPAPVDYKTALRTLAKEQEQS
jgi:hypothetical protein